jgi:hypothetical protein
MKVSLMAVVAGFCLVVGLPLAAMAGPTPGGASTADGDNIEDFFDNCYLDANPEQKDVDHDGCGDACDQDGNNDGQIGSADFTLFKLTFQKQEGDPGYNSAFDANCDGAVGSADFSIFKSNFQQPTGPSGFPASQKLSSCSGPN